MSTSRRCDIYKAKDGKWYMFLGNYEYAWDIEDCTAYGPFADEEAAIKELDNHSNPGGWVTDKSGTREAPKGEMGEAQGSTGTDFTGAGGRIGAGRGAGSESIPATTLSGSQSSMPTCQTRTFSSMMSRRNRSSSCSRVSTFTSSGATSTCQRSSSSSEAPAEGSIQCACAAIAVGYRRKALMAIRRGAPMRPNCPTFLLYPHFSDQALSTILLRLKISSD